MIGPFSIPAFVGELLAWANREPRGQPQGADGGTHQRARLVAMADWACRTWPGDLLETGTYTGDTAIALAAVARQYGRKVYTIDSYPAGTSYQLAERVHGEALAAMAPYRDVIEFWHGDVLSVEGQAWLARRPLAMAFCDTMKHHDHVRVELGCVMPVTAGLVAVDDTNYCESALRAVMEKALESKGDWLHVHLGALRETWLVRRP